MFASIIACARFCAKNDVQARILAQTKKTDFAQAVFRRMDHGPHLPDDADKADRTKEQLPQARHAHRISSTSLQAYMYDEARVKVKETEQSILELVKQR